MLSKEKLDKLNNFLAAGYDRSKWLDVLGDLFHPDNIIQFASPRIIPTNDIAAKFEQIGEIKGVQVGNTNDMEFAVFEIQINHQTQLHRNRAQLRNLVARHMGPYQGALAVYHDPNQSQWRFSFISKEQSMAADGTISEHETPPKRFTYLLGEGTQIRTAINRFAELAKARTAKGVSLEALKAAFAVETLNKEFYGKLFDWYEAAKGQAEFPNDEKTNYHREIALIRLLTRLLFVWFIKEKGLVSAEFFDKERVQELINWEKPSSYYKAILQNLFFATLNKGITERRFRDPIKKNAINNKNYMITNIYRYEDYFNDNKEDIIIRFARTPFLNGGLFECLDREASPAELKEYDENPKLRNEKETIRVDGFSDRDDNKIKLPNELFFSDDGDTGLIDILSQYQFTLEENTALDNDIALDPELLGRVFENLLASYNPETQQVARKASGSYYTPREIVSYMVDESLKAYLSQTLMATQNIIENLKPTLIQTGKEQRSLTVPVYTPEESDEQLNALFAAHSENKFNTKQTNLLIKAIDKIKILDPAVGSGAFAMGALNRLVELLDTLDPANQQWKKQQLSGLNDPESIVAVQEVFSPDNQYNNYGRKLYLIQKAIFGVDIQSIAIQICKLRFFISLVIEQAHRDNTDKNHHIKPLPNLEIKFVAADSLIPLNEPIEEGHTRSFINSKAERIKKELESTRSKMFAAKTYANKKKLRDKDEELRLRLAEELENDNWGENAANLIANWNPYNQGASADWFDANYMFGVSSGFDIVIGNPPYVQLQKEDGRLAKRYQKHKYETFAGAGDIYQLFYERGHDLLNNTGHLCYITSNKWMRAGYGKLTRNYFASRTQPNKLMDLGPDIFESATVDTNILLLNKQPQGESFLSCTVKKSDKNVQIDLREQSWLSFSAPSEDGPWVILSSEQRSIKEKMETIGTPLKKWNIEMFRGISTGYNRAFIINTKTKERLCQENANSIHVIKPVLRGRDIERYHAEWAGFWLIFIPWHFPLHEDKSIHGMSVPAEEEFQKQYPAIYTHLLQYKKELTTRNKEETGIRYEWYALQRWAATYYSEFKKEKIAWQRVTQQPTFCLSPPDEYILDSMAFISHFDDLEPLCLMAVLNSALIRYWVDKNVHQYGNTGYRLSNQYVEEIPVPKITMEKQRPIVELAKKILTVKKENPDTDTSGYESEIDHLVYKLYDLTDAEIAIVEAPINGNAQESV